jgi:hypothetical protein
MVGGGDVPSGPVFNTPACCVRSSGKQKELENMSKDN